MNRDETVELDPSMLTVGFPPLVLSILADDAVWNDPPPELADSVVAAIVTEASESTNEFPLPNAAEIAAAERAAGMVTIERSRSLIPATVACLLALALGIAGGWWAHQRSQEGSARPTTDVLSFSGKVTGPGVTGTAAASAFSTGWKVTLDVTGLSNPGKTAYYQAWLRRVDANKPADVRVVPLGTFLTGDELTFWTAVSPEEFPQLIITRQAVGPGPAPGVPQPPRGKALAGAQLLASP